MDKVKSGRIREIVFRGLHRRKGEKVRLDGSPVESMWVFGGYCQYNEERGIIYQTTPDIHKYPVFPDTVGQYTGLTDKNGKRIFEGDIITDRESGLYGKVVYATASDGYDGMSGFMVEDINDGLQDYNGFWHLVEVIGNIHDNPELLEVE